MNGFKTRGLTHTVTAADVTAGSVVFPVGDSFQAKGAVVQVTTSAGVPKAWDGARTITPEKVTVDNTGTTDFAAGDVISVVAFG